MRVVNNFSASPALGLTRVRNFRFSRDREIGRGGYARVYAQTGRAGGEIAVKVDARGVVDAGFMDVFIKREARALSRFKHPNIVRCRGYGRLSATTTYSDFNTGMSQEHRPAFLALEYLEKGEFFDARTYVAKSGGNRLPDALRIFKQVLLAVEYIHGQGWVHVDLKENNILTDGQKVKLIDFAFARPVGNIISGESDSGTLGTVEYMSLRRLEKKRPIKADDLYALGIALCGMLLPDLFESRRRELKCANRRERGRIASAFQRAQTMLELRLNCAQMPEQVKDLMRKLIGLDGAEPFSDCREILDYLAF